MYRTLPGHASGESCRPLPATRQPGCGTAGRQQRARFALHSPWTTMLEPVRLMAHSLLTDPTRATTRIELSMLVATQALNPDEQSGMSPVDWPGARQLVNEIFTAPQGSRSGPLPSSLIWMLQRVASPVLVTTAYQVMLLAIVPQSGV